MSVISRMRGGSVMSGMRGGRSSQPFNAVVVSLLAIVMLLRRRTHGNAELEATGDNQSPGVSDAGDNQSPGVSESTA